MRFSSGVSFDGSTYTGTRGPDSIEFINTSVQDVTVAMGRGRDTVSFGGTGPIGTGVVVDLGRNDGSADRLIVATEQTLSGSGLRVVNFEDGRDSIVVAGTVYSTRAEAAAAINAIQPGSISFES